MQALTDSTALTTFYMAATPRPGTEGAFEEGIRRLADCGTIDGVRLSVIDLTGTSAALRGQMPETECPECPEALATYLEDQLASREGVHVDLDVSIA
jgi:hypothetical protein